MTESLFTNLISFVILCFMLYTAYKVGKAADIYIKKSEK